jgi:hypothetical protein
MNRKGNCWDNACAETFFRTLKTELETLDGKHFWVGSTDSVFEYLKSYYNRKRLHSALDYSTPADAVCKKNGLTYCSPNRGKPTSVDAHETKFSAFGGALALPYAVPL